MKNNLPGKLESLLHLSRTEGWTLVEEYLHLQIKDRQSRLETLHSTDIADFARLQGEIKGLRAPLIFLQDRLRHFRQSQPKGE